MTLASVTEGAARSTALKVTQAERSHGIVPRHALFDGCAPESSNDPATALQPILATQKMEGVAHCMVNESGLSTSTSSK